MVPSKHSLVSILLKLPAEPNNYTGSDIFSGILITKAKKGTQVPLHCILVSKTNRLLNEYSRIRKVL
jgi:hypothetical protein